MIFRKPVVRKFDSIPVYDVKNIYHQKILTLVGTRLKVDEVGREVFEGRREAQDYIVDVYYLSKKFVLCINS